jgi:hypothetical protein
MFSMSSTFSPPKNRPPGSRLVELGTRIRRGVFSFLRSEDGRSLPAALIAITLGTVLLVPFLSFVSSRSLSTREAAGAFEEQYAADAGIEFGIWSLLEDPAIRSQADASPGTAVSVPFPETINGLTPTVTVTARPLGEWFIREPVSPDYVGSGGALAFPSGYAGGNYLYAMMGQGSSSFQQFDRSNSTDPWTEITSIPWFYYWNNSSGDLAYAYGDDIYTYFPGFVSYNPVFRHNASTSTWNSLGNTPVRPQIGSALAYGGGDQLFMLQGGGRDFWRYDIPSGDWDEMKKLQGFASAARGADLVHTGGRYLYALMGGNSQVFMRFDKNTGNKGKWERMADTPGPVGGGGSLAYFSGDHIYALQGGGSDQFWRYTISSDTWTALTPTPAGVGNGGDLTMVGPGNGYALRGGNNPDFWEFIVTPPRYDVRSQAGEVEIHARSEIIGTSHSIIFWSIE